MSLDNRIVIITGALGNLGAAAVRAFEHEGARLALVDRSSERLRKAYGDLEAAGHLLLGGVDLTDEAAVEAMAAEVYEQFGRLDVLFNTVGAFRGGLPIHDEDPSTWEFLHAVNVRTTLLTCRAALPYLLGQAHGRIINTASADGLTARAGFGAYSAAKSAVLRLTESLAAEVGPAGINVNAVLPGTLDTPVNREAMPNADFTTWVEPAAVAEVVVFLASEAARAVHGTAVPVYGRS